MRHTPPPPVDIAAIIPGFSALARQTVRLHPRLGECAIDDNKLGGLFLWPEDESWPYNEESNLPFVPILQLRAEDVPEIGFPDGKDLFQLLWCFNDQLTCKVFWRNRHEFQKTLVELPEFVLAEIEAKQGLYPTPCVLYPERVVEYPHLFDLMDNYPALDQSLELSERLIAAIASLPQLDYRSPADVYQFLLSTADGTKVGGYPNWVQDPEIPDNMEYLLTIATTECDGGTWQRWLPQEDRNGWSKWDDWDDSVTNAANLTIGDIGYVNVFIDREHGEYPVKAVMQCS